MEIKFNEISYPAETTFQPSFSLKVRKAEKDCLEHHSPVFEIDEFLKKVEQ
ncbi:hypothetical protein MSHOH_2713 [Methanosarcina horonobensis HB-1 = JCM 15518]|uniref:Uncharacterized protein n=1 Tax=Methanosarcina horonobensis HB-1 = JCM 15518 TaxID=1434110 RepID=A0A0E3SE79_9EURY|nr:hypothetical protein MSHOH_2713 [Methanosarcina horonobensis HB-1 = JCM 15518]